jgi:GNAT superfamily N-acetyltransferase
VRVTEARTDAQAPIPQQMLTDGWERVAPIEDTLLRRFVFAYADRTAAMAARVGGRSEADDVASLADLGSPFRYDNAVVLLRPPTSDSLTETVKRAHQFYPERRSWVLLSVWPLPDLSPHGLGLEGHPPLMFRAPRDPSLVPSSSGVPADLRIETVRTDAQLTDFRNVLLDGYPLVDETGAFVALDAVNDVLTLFVGYVDGLPVSVAGAVANHGVVEVDWVATLPAWRGRGYGQALTAAAIAVGPDLPAVLIASDDGRRMYERMGFVSLLRATMWARTPDWSRPI